MSRMVHTSLEPCEHDSGMLLSLIAFHVSATLI